MGVDQHWTVMIILKKNVTKQIESLSFDPPPDVPPPPPKLGFNEALVRETSG